METVKTILAALVVLLLAITAMQAYQVSALSEKVSAVAAGSASFDGHSSYDEMMAAHHGGEVPAASSGAQQGLGGC